MYKRQALLRTVIAKGSVAIKDTLDYDAMSELMWAGSLSHNGLTGLGGREDFAVHQLGHELSAMFDTAHGASLATVWGSWALAVYDAKPGRFARYAKNVWGLDGDDEETLALAGIQATVDYFRSLGMPVSFGDNKDIGIQEDTVLRDLAFRCKMCIRDRYIIFLSSSLVSVKYQADRIALPVKKYAVIPVKFPIQILIRDRSGQSFNINLFRGILTDIELPFVKRLIHPVVTVLIEHNRTAIFMLPVIIHRRIWAVSYTHLDVYKRQDDHSPVHDLGIQRILQIPKLGRREFIITDNSGGVKLPDTLPNLLDLSLSQIGSRMDPLPVLHHLVHGHGSRCLD